MDCLWVNAPMLQVRQKLLKIGFTFLSATSLDFKSQRICKTRHGALYVVLRFKLGVHAARCQRRDSDVSAVWPGANRLRDRPISMGGSHAGGPKLFSAWLSRAAAMPRPGGTAPPRRPSQPAGLPGPARLPIHCQAGTVAVIRLHGCWP